MATTHTSTCICAWCLKEKGEKPREQDSHGICTAHAEKMMQEAAQSRQERQEQKRRR